MPLFTSQNAHCLINRLNRFEYFSLHNTIDISIGNGKGLALPIEMSMEMFSGITANIAVRARILYLVNALR